MQLRRPPGDCTLRIVAEGYGAIERNLVDVDLGLVYLQKLPVLSGTVVDATTAAPLPRAEVLLPDGTALAQTDGQGRFRSAIDGPWPALLRVVATGRAIRTVEVPKAVADADLRIALSAGGSLAVTLAEPLGREEVTWDLRRMFSSSREESVRSGKVPAGKTTFGIDALEAGRYRLVIKGRDPLQRYGSMADVADGETTEIVVRIEPALLELEVRLGVEPIAPTSLELLHDEAGWRETLFTGVDGRLVEEIWQRGRYSAFVSDSPRVSFWRDGKRIDEEGTTRWTIRIPERRLRGRVVDDASRHPIAEARIILQAKSAEGSASMIQQLTGAEGTFEFTAIPRGSYSLRVVKSGFLSLETGSLPVNEEQILETGDLVLQPALERGIRVVNDFGAPIVSAAVIVSGRSGIRQIGATDAAGRIALPVAAEERGIVFVLPRAGSIGFARFAALMDTTESEILVRVHEASVTLDVRTETSSGEPIAGMGVAMRIDGIFLPVEVQEWRAHYQGAPLGSDAQGRLSLRLPPGHYEIWPLASREDLLATRSSTPPPAPVNVRLTPGAHVAKLTFRPRN